MQPNQTYRQFDNPSGNYQVPGQEQLIPQQKPIDRTKLAIIGAGAVGAGLTGFFGHDIGEQLGIDNNKDTISELQKNISQNKDNLLNNSKDLKRLSEINTSKLNGTIDKELLNTDRNSPNQLLKDIAASQANEIAKMNPSDKEGISKIIENHNALKEQLRNQGDSGVGSWWNPFDNDVEDYHKKFPKIDGNFMTNDDMSSASESAKKLEDRISNMTDKTIHIANNESNMNPDTTKQYNISQKDSMIKHLNDSNTEQLKMLGNNTTALTNASNLDNQRDNVNRYSRIGAGIGGVLGGAGTAYGTHKLIEHFKNNKLKKEDEYKSTHNAAGEKIN